MSDFISSKPKYTLLDRVKSRSYRLLIITAIVLAAACITLLVLLIQSKKHHDSPPQPNVSLFNLPAEVTPPGGENLILVYHGFGKRLAASKV